MWLGLSLHFVFLTTVFAKYGTQTDGAQEINLHNVGCSPTKCPRFCPRGVVGYHYYFDRKDSCLRCSCGRPTGLADCGEDINPSLCNSVDLSYDCQKNSTVIQNCKFSCSQSGKLWRSALQGNLKEVNTAIAAGASSLCQKTSTEDYIFPNMTAIHMAALGNHPEVIVALLQNAAVDINQQTSLGGTPTYYASWKGSTDALEVLIEHNADINIPARDGMTPLMVAALLGQLSVVKPLIDSNANINLMGGLYNATALHYAIGNKHQDIALLLIEHNADINVVSSSGMTPLMAASQEGQLNVVKALINSNASINMRGGLANATALHFAASSSYDAQDVALLLLQSGADTMILDKDGRTPAAIATYFGNNQLADLIESYSTITTTTMRDGITSF